MRKDVTPPSLGSSREIKVFLWFPKTIQSERRWLEVAVIKQVRVRRSMGFSYECYWQDREWVNP